MAISWMADRPWVLQWFFCFVPMMFLFLLGCWAATVHKRCQTTGVLVTRLLAAVLLVESVALITLQAWWPAVGAWVITLTPPPIGALASAFVRVLGFAAFATLRRATRWRRTRGRVTWASPMR